MAKRRLESNPGTIAGAITAAAGAYVVAPQGTRFLAATWALAPPVIERITNKLREAYRARFSDRVNVLLSAYLQGKDGVDARLAEAQLQALADDPNTRDLVIDAFRVIDDAMIEQAVFVMGVLTRRYRESGRKADWFSRGVRRIMTDVAEEDYLALREILTILDGADSAVDDLSLRFHSTGGAPQLVLAYPHRLQPDAGARSEAHPIKSRPDCASRVLELLKAARFGRDGASVSSVAVAGLSGMVIARSSAREFLSLMP